jgi:capsular polysaccharide biosynthesis protein
MPDNGYFHFLIEDLPRFIQVRNLHRQTHTIIGSSSKYVRQAINILNPDNHSLEVSPVKVENLYISKKIHGQLFTNYDSSVLRSTFSPYINQNVNKKIFVSRKATRKY